MNNRPQPDAGDNGRPLHRLGQLRKRRRLSLAEAARRLEIEPQAARQQEQSTSDLNLSVIYRWQQLLQVPVSELLIDLYNPLATPELRREKLAGVMRVTLAILEHTKQPAIRRMAHTLVDQLVELAPELKRVAKAHSAGQEQRFDAQGRPVKGPLPVDFFLDPID